MENSPIISLFSNPFSHLLAFLNICLFAFVRGDATRGLGNRIVRRRQLWLKDRFFERLSCETRWIRYLSQSGISSCIVKRHAPAIETGHRSMHNGIDFATF